ncbi:MAG: DUF5924 family protein [bacterium]
MKQPVKQIVGKVKQTIEKHHDKLWWAHSIYALGLGVVVVFLAHRKFHLVKWLILALVGIWVGLLFFQRFLAGLEGSTTRKGVKVVFNYIMKNLYQQMFFFMIPFYYDATTFGSANMWFLVAIVICAILSTQDIIFDRHIMENKLLASFFYAFCLFASFNIFLPLLAGVRNIVSLYLSGVFTLILFCSLHFRANQLLSRAGAVAMVVALGLFLTLLEWGRRAIPPAPIRQVSSTMAVARDKLTGKPVGRFYRIHVEDLKDATLYCFTKIETPLKIKEDIKHIWRKRGRRRPWYQKKFNTVHSRSEEGVALVSELSTFPPNPAGEWIVEAMTTGGQLIGETRFLVVK